MERTRQASLLRPTPVLGFGTGCSNRLPDCIASARQAAGRRRTRGQRPRGPLVLLLDGGRGGSCVGEIAGKTRSKRVAGKTIALTLTALGPPYKSP
jgi:hypothetical protein